LPERVAGSDLIFEICRLAALRKYRVFIAGGAPGVAEEAGRRFIDALQLVYHVANIGDARTLAIHPATTTHSQLSEEDRLATGVSEGYVRLSIGIEHSDDILADLSQALEQA
jgi:O-acetylhomoserine (thiol)-lyase